MTQKDINNWIMYQEIHRLSRLGFSAPKIARYLVLDTRTVKKILAMTDQDYEKSLLKAEQRTKTLTPYESFVHDKLKLYADTSAAQMHDWLKESHPELPSVSQRSVYNFVMFVRQKYNIPFESITRDFFPVKELPYGDQAQVDFGEYNMRQANDSRKKVRFFAMVLSRSRMKYICFSDVPYTAKTVCEAHEKAFAFFGGVPRTLVYDQDRTMLVDENIGDLILTATFKQYNRSRKFNLHFCRKSDPQSKGKIENVIQYVKKNFLYNRPYSDLETLNSQAGAWLSRTANRNIHNYTKKSPESEFIIEKPMLEPYTPLTIEIKEIKMYHVRKTNTINYKSNFYSLPMGTYKGPGTKVKLKQINNLIEIRDLKDELICSHELSTLIGQTISNTHHRRDNSKSLELLLAALSARFSLKDVATLYLQAIKALYPRYSRDHWQAIDKAITKSEADQNMVDSALDFCVSNEIFNGYNFEDVLMVLCSQSKPIKAIKPIALLDKTNLDKANQTPAKSDINEYEKIINS